VKGKNQFFYSSAIKLPSAIGDWTQIKADNDDDEFFEVSEINYSNFDGISKEDLKFVHFIHHRLAAYLTNHLSHDLNVKIELHTITATQLLYSDFIDSISDRVFQANINFPDQGSINILFGSKLASMILDRLVGGGGSQSAKQEFNAFELEILNEQLQQLIPHFQKTWDDILDFSKANMTLFSGEYRPDNHISYRGTTVVFTIYLFFGDGELLRLMVAYPSHLISHLITLFRSKHRTIKSLIKLDNKTVKGIDYNVIAELGTTQLSMNTLKDLSVGDIISLNKPLHSLIKLKIGDYVTLTGQPCIYKDRLGCQIVLSKKVQNSVSLIHDVDMQEESHVTVPVTLSTDSFVDNNTIDAVSDKDYSDGAPFVSSEDLVSFLPQELIDEEDEYSKQEDVDSEEVLSEDSYESYQDEGDSDINFEQASFATSDDEKSDISNDDFGLTDSDEDLDSLVSEGNESEDTDLGDELAEDTDSYSEDIALADLDEDLEEDGDLDSLVSEGNESEDIDLGDELAEDTDSYSEDIALADLDEDLEEDGDLDSLVSEGNESEDIALADLDEDVEEDGDLDSPVFEADLSEDSDVEDTDLGDALAEDTDSYSEDIALADLDEDVEEDGDLDSPVFEADLSEDTDLGDELAEDTDSYSEDIALADLDEDVKEEGDLANPVSEDDVNEDSDGEGSDLADELAEDTDSYSEDIDLDDSAEKLVDGDDVLDNQLEEDDDSQSSDVEDHDLVSDVEDIDLEDLENLHEKKEDFDDTQTESIEEEDFLFDSPEQEVEDVRDGVFDRSVLFSSDSMDDDDSVQKQDNGGEGDGNSDGDPLESDDDNTL